MHLSAHAAGTAPGCRTDTAACSEAQTEQTKRCDALAVSHKCTSMMWLSATLQARLYIRLGCVPQSLFHASPCLIFGFPKGCWEPL